MNLQNQFLQQKLNSGPSFQISSVGSRSGGPPCSVAVTDQKPPLYSNPVDLQRSKIFEKKRRILLYSIDGWPIFAEANLFALWQDRILNCPGMKSFYLVDELTGLKLHPHPIKGACLNPFCTNPYCITAREILNYERLKEYKIKSKDLYHFNIGFEPVEKLTFSALINYHRIYLKIIKEVEKRFPKLHLIAVFDFNRSDEKIRAHLHIASLPFKDFKTFDNLMLRACRVISRRENTSVQYNYGKFTPRKGVFDYFAQRLSGVFGHEKKGTQFFFKDFLSPDEYFFCFYGTRKIFAHNLSKSNPSGASGFIKALCNSLKIPLKLRKFKPIFVPEEVFKPPGFECPSCGAPIECVDEINWHLEVCHYCASAVHNISYPSGKESERTKFILSRI